MATVYILQCANGQYYVGSTTNIARRLDEHQLSQEAQYRGAKFTKAHQPVKLVYTEEYDNEPTIEARAEISLLNLCLARRRKSEAQHEARTDARANTMPCWHEHC